MISIATNTPFGKRVHDRLHKNPVAWLVTGDGNGTPQPSLIWFLWDGQTILIYSQPEKPKLRNIEQNPRVSVHLDCDGRGGDVVVLTGSAVIDSSNVPATDVPNFITKYQDRIAGIGMTQESFAGSYSVPIRITLEKLRGH